MLFLLAEYAALFHVEPPHCPWVAPVIINRVCINARNKYLAAHLVE
jgi:hypothetical protein